MDNNKLSVFRLEKIPEIDSNNAIPTRSKKKKKNENENVSDPLLFFNIF